jgi:YD repeat-containing protein
MSVRGRSRSSSAAPTNSQSATDGRLGQNWSHSYSAQIQPGTTPGQALAIRPDGQALTFTGSPDFVEWLSSPDTNSKLEKLPDGGWRYTTGSDDVETYDVTGMLRTIKTREGFTQDLFYEGGRLAKVVDLTDPFLVRTLTFEYDESNRIRKITDPAGGTYIYEYDSTNHLEFVTGPQRAEKPLEPRQYLYENGLLTGVIDENGARFATFSYDQGRAKSSELAGGTDKVEVTYDPNGKISVKDALNTERSYEYDPKFVDIKRTSKATKPSSDGGSVSSSWSYYDDGNILESYRVSPCDRNQVRPLRPQSRDRPDRGGRDSRRGAEDRDRVAF